MQFIPNTVLGLFDSSQKSYEIPVYQRAYSWEKQNWKTFLDDLLEQVQGHNNYFFGNLLLEVISKNKKYEVIDGQQRITTLTIFMRSMLNVLKNRINDPVLSNFDYVGKESIYFKNSGNIKLRPVEYDRACFDALIIDNKNNFSVGTPSQKRIKSAKEYFEKELDKIDSLKLLEILDKTENTGLTIIELEGKKDSALMFELENNRGKELTNMEKIKSYFMYQMYVYSTPKEVEVNIESISNIFKLIYLIINDLKKINEDSILIYHNNAYIKGFAYRTLDDVKDDFKSSDNKIEWIKSYVEELHTTFSNVKKFEMSNDLFAQRLNQLGTPAFIYPFIIKGYKYFVEDETKLNQLFNVLEVITFRARLINSRANIQERLNLILLSFNGDLPDLLEKVHNKLNESWYWGDSNTKNYLNGSMYGNNVLNYMLWRYENYIQNKGYSIRIFSIENEQIEHISPQNPTNGEPIETGYEVDANNQYSDEFTAQKLNSMGNLMLISGSHNASIGNKPFSEKLATYKTNPRLNQQAEIIKFAKTENDLPIWKSESIDERQAKLLIFAIENWSFDRIKVTPIQ
ncbi:MAG: DUF262 domain-containing protein [Chitinophagaceae bacterium]|nr:DUF262 domain-containing protein [Chitinophagaceae bacterium]